MGGSIDIPGEPEDFEYQVRLSLDRINKTLADQNRTLDKLDHAINGNGKPGLLTRVQTNESFISVIQRLIWVTIISAIGLGVAGLFTAAVYLIRVMPQ